LALAIGVAPARAFEDFSGGAYQILPPGAEGGIVLGKNSNSQLRLYEALTPAKGDVTQGDIEKDYLSEKFGVTGPVLHTETTPRGAGLEIVYDKHDIPHIYGATRGDVMYGSGWVAVAQRGLLLKEGIGPAYVAALSVPGLNAFELLIDGRSFTPSAQAISFVTKQQSVLLEEKGAAGAQVLSDLENFVEGENAYDSESNRYGLPKLTVDDAIAGFAFIGSIFGNGGGGEVQSSEFLSALESKFGEAGGKQIFRDLREVNDPEAPTTTNEPFPYDQEPSGPTPGALLVEPGSESNEAVKAAVALKASRRKASNFLLAGAGDAADGHPMAVMGPQLGYYYPEIVQQMDLHGPGIDASGVGTPIEPYVFIGRGRDFAWSLTSAGSENVQQFLLKLCNPDLEPVSRESEYYEHDGECIKMETFDAGELGASGSEPAREVYFKESLYGPVSGTVLVNGEPYAIANDRSDRGREPDGEVAFSKLDSDEVHNPQEFFEAANELETTFNMAYIDDENIAYFSTGRLPVLAPGTNPSLPTLGNGEYDWRGFLTLEQHPHAVHPVSDVNPASDDFTNWNNKPAPDWGAASENYSYGPIQRVQLFKGFKTGMTEASDASIMNKAATQDLPAVLVWPSIEEVLNSPGPAPSATATQAVKKIKQWVKQGASRYGKEGPTNPAAAILDAAWTPIGDSVLEPVLGGLMGQFESLIGPENAPNSQGSSYDSGWYGYVYKAMRTVLGDEVAQPFSDHPYCGGSLVACRSSLWSAIEAAVGQLETEQGSEMKAWRAAKVRISFEPEVVDSGHTMSWTNRSTFQQIIEFTGHAPE
jgi:acyl-homoserine lactone acylase PvdQ